MRTQKDVSGDKPNLQAIDEQNVTASGDCGNGVGKSPTDTNVTEFRCNPQTNQCNRIQRLNSRFVTLFTYSFVWTNKNKTKIKNMKHKWIEWMMFNQW